MRVTSETKTILNVAISYSQNLYMFIYPVLFIVGRDSSVSKATRCGLGGPGIESR